MTDKPVQSQSTDPYRSHDLSDVTLPDDAGYRILLSHWTGTDESPEKPPEIVLSASSAEPYEIGAMLSLTAEQARALAEQLIAAAEKIEGGWQ